MERRIQQPRPDWQQRCEAVGFHFHSVGGVYWDESACYRFTATEIDQLEEATLELHGLCLNAVEAVIRQNLFHELAIEASWIPRIIQSWEAQQPSLYGRFDLHYDGRGPAKLLEYNADTPTMLLESSVAQWFWLQECQPQADQFNSLHEKLIQRWQEVWPDKETPFYLACAEDSPEDWGNVAYLLDTAVQAGVEARFIHMEEIGFDWLRQCFVDLEEQPIRALFKLYPWEWMVREQFGPLMLQHPLTILEPPWKMILSNKALLPLLWRLFPDHPHLLPAWREPPRGSIPLIKKPIFSREGANIDILQGGQVAYASEERGYGGEGFIYQHYLTLPCFDGNHAVIGSWMVGDQAAGMGIREDASPITQSGSRFIPHYFE